MKREAFREINNKHFKTCEKLIEQNGICQGIECDDCPFDFGNAVNDRICTSNKYATEDNYKKNELCIKSAKEFLKFREIKETNKTLKDFSTKELTDELIKRGGIEFFNVDPYEQYTIRVNGKIKSKDSGPAILIVNID